MVRLVDTVPHDHRPTIGGEARHGRDSVRRLLDWGNGSEIALAAVADDGGRRVQGSAMRWAWKAAMSSMATRMS